MNTQRLSPAGAECSVWLSPRAQRARPFLIEQKCPVCGWVICEVRCLERTLCLRSLPGAFGEPMLSQRSRGQWPSQSDEVQILKPDALLRECRLFIFSWTACSQRLPEQPVQWALLWKCRRERNDGLVIWGALISYWAEGYSSQILSTLPRLALPFAGTRAKWRWGPLVQKVLRMSSQWRQSMGADDVWVSALWSWPCTQLSLISNPRKLIFEQWQMKWCSVGYIF